MPATPSSGLQTLLGERGPCPVCDGFDCEHEFYGDNHYRFGDPMSKHPRMQGRTIPAPHRIVADERVVFGEGDLMTAEEAERYGVTKPKAAPRGKRKGERSRKPTEDRAAKPAEDR